MLALLVVDAQNQSASGGLRARTDVSSPPGSGAEV
jgi:hypothetical protein